MELRCIQPVLLFLCLLLLLLFNGQVFAPAAFRLTLLIEKDGCYQEAPDRGILGTSSMKFKAADISPNQDHVSIHLVPFVTLLALMGNVQVCPQGVQITSRSDTPTQPLIILLALLLNSNKVVSIQV